MIQSHYTDQYQSQFVNTSFKTSTVSWNKQEFSFNKILRGGVAGWIRDKWGSKVMQGWWWQISITWGENKLDISGIHTHKKGQEVVLQLKQTAYSDVCGLSGISATLSGSKRFCCLAVQQWPDLPIVGQKFVVELLTHLPNPLMYPLSSSY